MLILKGSNLLFAQRAAPGTLHIQDGKIIKIGDEKDIPGGVPVVDVGDAIVMPGIVDTHVHFNEPGRTEWEGFQTGTKAAAAGGITTIVDMPLNSLPPTTTMSALHEKAACARGHAWVNFGFWGGVIPGNSAELEPMIDAGALGFKCFLIDSGVEEFPRVTENDLSAAMPILARRQVPLLVHAELESEVTTTDHSSRSYAAYLKSRPRDWENRAVSLMIGLSKKHRCPVHIVHLSSSEALALIGEARASGVPITAETCPHYLALHAEEIPDGSTHFKCAPPIREKENQEKLWAGLRTNVIDFVVSDHSPCIPALKLRETGDFMRAWGGIASVQFTLPLVWTEARRRGFSLHDVVRWMCEKPALLAGLGDRKGKLAPGFDADLVVWNPEAQDTIHAGAIRYRHPITPYEGRALSGKVEMTFVGGNLVFDRGELAKLPTGTWVKRTRGHAE